jgi:hypothetical protein
MRAPTAPEDATGGDAALSPDATPTDDVPGLDVAPRDTVAIEGGAEASATDTRPDVAPPPPDASPCPIGQRLCGGACVDVQSDMAHCGRCNNPCKPTFGGACCAGACVQLDDDAANCGMCGRACGETLECVSRSCRCGAVRPFVCGDRCADLRTDPMNCGVCGRVCPTGQRCVSSGCTP